MAKKSGGFSILGHIGAFSAFVGVFTQGILFILGLFDITGGFCDTASMIASWLLLIAVTFVGWSYLRTNNLPGPDIIWTALYLFFVVLAFVGTMPL